MFAFLKKDLKQDLPAPPSPIVIDDCHDDIPIDRVVCPDLKWIAQRWSDIPVAEGNNLPSWSSFDLKSFVPLLSKLCGLHVRNGCTETIEFSLYGGHPTKYIGLGKPLRLSEMRNHSASFGNYVDIRERAARAVTNERPQYVRKTLSWNGRDDIEYEAIMLPFTPDGSGVQRILQPVSAWLPDGDGIKLPDSGVL